MESRRRATCSPTTTATRWRCCDHCQDNDIPFLYASSAAVYGAGPGFREERACEAPLNVYGYSKFLFDQHVRRTAARTHCADRRLPLLQRLRAARSAQGHGWRRWCGISCNQYRATGKVQLFEGSGGYAAGEQRRDFVSVDDVDRRSTSIFSTIPSARASSTWAPAVPRRFNAVAAATINACRAADGAPALPFEELHRTGAIEYIGFPRGAGRANTRASPQADLSRLRAAGYTATDARRSSRASRAVSRRCLRNPRSTRNIAPALHGIRPRPERLGASGCSLIHGRQS